MIIEQIELEHGTALGLKFDMNNAPLLVIKAPKGFVMCGYLNIEMAETIGDAAVRVRGVSTFDDVLNADALEVTTEAGRLGITEGMSGRECLNHMF